MSIWVVGRDLMKHDYRIRKDFYSNLNIENIADADHKYVKRVWKDFKIKNLGEYHNLYVQRNTLLVVDVFESFSSKCIEIYELDSAKLLSTPALAWQSCLNETEIELEILTDIDMLLIIEKGIRGGICHAIHQYGKTNNKYMNDYNKDKESYLMYWDANNSYGWSMSQKLPVDNLKWEKAHQSLIGAL